MPPPLLRQSSQPHEPPQNRIFASTRDLVTPAPIVPDYGRLMTSPGDQDMPQGTVKWFNPTKGYGFIQPQEGGKDVFVHISAVERAGLTTLNEGQVVQFELVENRGKTSAENLKVK